MASGHKPCLPLEGAFDVKHQVTCDLSITRQYLTIIRNLECQSNIEHFLFNGIMPEGCPHLLINGKCLFHRVG